MLLLAGDTLIAVTMLRRYGTLTSQRFDDDAAPRR